MLNGKQANEKSMKRGTKLLFISNLPSNKSFCNHGNQWKWTQLIFKKKRNKIKCNQNHASEQRMDA